MNQTMNKSKCGSEPTQNQDKPEAVSIHLFETGTDASSAAKNNFVLKESKSSMGYRVDHPKNQSSGNDELLAGLTDKLIDGRDSFRSSQSPKRASGKETKHKVRKRGEDAALTGSDKDSPLQIYLNEIGRIPLLTSKQEVELAARYKNGDESAKEQMVVANLRLVVKIARDYENLGLPILDLISEGNIGLIKAVERFDPEKGGKLSTYGSWWIKQSIKRALANQSKTIRLPVHLVDKISKMRRVISKLHEKLGREATDEEISRAIKIPVHKVSHWKNISLNPASLDAPIGDDEHNSFAEVVEDESASTPYQELEEKTVANMIRSLLSNLSERENFILTYRYGLDGDGEKTLEEVGAKFGITRERVRQIQNTALEKMRKDLERLENQDVAA